MTMRNDLILERATTIMQKKPEPFVKWVGGKRSTLNELLPSVPLSFKNYHEPFIGGGALFFALNGQIKNATVSDNNFDLIMTYKAIQKDPKALIARLKEHVKKHGEKHYYETRASETEDPIEIASKFIYLNKTCYNGLYRVNKLGKFNVPMGKYNNPAILQEENIWACHEALKKTTIQLGDFTRIKAEAGDFVYFDPPYHPTTDVSFTGYTKENFTEQDQVRLRDFALELSKKGVKVMLSNSNTPFIRDLYESKKFFVKTVLAPRMVNCKPKERNGVKEVLITNYPLPKL